MSSRHRTRGRQILLCMGLLFVAAQAGAGLLFDHVWPQVRFPFLHRRLAALPERTPAPTVVAVGSSRFGACLIEEDISHFLQAETGADSASFFNAAVPAGDLVSSEHALRCLLSRAAPPKMLLIEICPEALNRHMGWLDYHIERQVGWGDVPDFLPEACRAGELERLCQCRLCPLLAHRKGFWNLLGNQATALAKKVQGRSHEEWARAIGMRPTYSAEEKERRGREGLKTVRRALDDYEAGGLPLEKLHAMLELCRDKGIAPLLIVVPVSSMHRALYDVAIEKAFIDCLRETCTRHGCRYLDCREAIPDGGFYDNHHATLEGGRAFSVWLTGRLPHKREVCGRPTP